MYRYLYQWKSTLKSSAFRCLMLLVSIVQTILLTKTHAQALGSFTREIPTATSLANPPSTADIYPHENEPIGNVRQIYNGALFPDIQVNTFRNTHRLFPTRLVRAGSDSSHFLWLIINLRTLYLDTKARVGIFLTFCP
jgi:hypothetical protein